MAAIHAVVTIISHDEIVMMSSLILESHKQVHGTIAMNNLQSS